MYLCQHTDVIPLKFTKYSGIETHSFRIRNKYQLHKLSPESGYEIEAYIDNVWQKIILSFEEYPNQIESLAILSKLSGETERQGRYINVHTAYESVVNNRDVSFSPIRHALAHPVTKLTRKNVRESLIERFGELDIDLSNYYHQKEIYRCIGQMLIQIDNSIFEVIKGQPESE